MGGTTDSLVVINQQTYHVQGAKVWLPEKLLTRVNKIADDAFVPITGIVWEKPSFGESHLRSIFATFQESDDVWCPSFGSFVILLSSPSKPCHIKSKRTARLNNTDGKLRKGPLVVEKATGQVFFVSRVVTDPNAAFISGIVPGVDSKGRFHEFHNQEHVQIVLPSRLYFEASDHQPLAGLRIGVKDSIAIRGLRTGFGSRAWLETAKTEKQTAPCIQRLLDAGAIIVGKLVTSEFAEGVEPREWTQGVCPFNPRGDGQQKPSSSSTGSAVAAAAYDWLDVTIGTDTGGSIRHPAGVNGLFGQRPSSGLVDLTGVLGATNLFNTVGIFARSVDLFTRVGSLLAGVATEPSPKLARKFNLLYPTRALPNPNRHHGNAHRWFPHPETDPSAWTEAERQIEKVVTQMEAEFDCRRIPFNINDVWRVTPPKGQPRSLDEATGKIYGDITTSSACATGIDDFVAEYKALHNGKEPAMSEIVARRLEYGRHLPNENIAAALDATAAFKSWMETTLFGSYDQDATTLLVFPQSCATPDYRDGKSRWDGNLFIEVFSIYAFGYLCGCPDYTIPVGEVSYVSEHSKDTEYLPVSMSLVGKPGTDRELFDVVQHLHRKGIISDVKAGARMYSEQEGDSHAS